MDSGEGETSKSKATTYNAKSVASNDPGMSEESFSITVQRKIMFSDMLSSKGTPG